MRLIYCFIFLLICNYSQAQVINVETLRKKLDSAKWTGSVSLDFSLIKNTNSIFKVANSADVQFNNKKELWLFISDLKLEKVEGKSYVNKGTQHLRYNHRLTKNIKMEAFVQTQFDAISEIDFRGLIGTGPRFKLSSSENYRFYLGTLIMYEYEKTSPVEEDRIRKALRGSAYFSFSLYPTKSLILISTTYYQPRLDNFEDYRFASVSSLLIKIIENLAFKTNLTYNFDAYPVVTIPQTQYELTNGVLFTF